MTAVAAWCSGRENKGAYISSDGSMLYFSPATSSLGFPSAVLLGGYSVDSASLGLERLFASARPSVHAASRLSYRA